MLLQLTFEQSIDYKIMYLFIENTLNPIHFLFIRELNDNLLTGGIPPELGKLTDLFDL